MNSHQRRKARRHAARRSMAFLDALVEFARRHTQLCANSNGSITLNLPSFRGHNHYGFAMFCLALCMACGTGIEVDDAGTPIEDAGQTDAGEYIADAGGLGTDAGPLDACEERQAQWCRQGCIGTIGIDRDCPELDCEC